MRIVRINFMIETKEKQQNEAFFDALVVDREAIEREVGEPLTWNRREDIKRCHVYTSRPGSIDDPPENLDELRQWGVDMLLRFRAVFAPRVRALRARMLAPDGGDAIVIDGREPMAG